eukprot:jgi/Mesen1/9380/ME000610S08688
MLIARQVSVVPRWTLNYQSSHCLLPSLHCSLRHRLPTTALISHVIKGNGTFHRIAHSDRSENSKISATAACPAVPPLKVAKKPKMMKREKVPLVAEYGPLPILFEDDMLLVVDKPAGIKHEPPSRHVGGSLINRVMGYLGQEAYTVHRLDMYTSGVLCFAKKLEGAHSLSRQFQRGQVKKCYWALVVGVPAGPFTVDAAIDRNPHHKFARMVASSGQQAVTLFSVLAANHASGVALLEAQPQTGRTHQIRVHLLHAGFPIMGDEIYGSLPILRDGVYGCGWPARAEAALSAFLNA